MKTFRVYLEDRTMALVPKGGTLEDFLRSLEGKTIKQILDDSTYMNLYMGNKYGLGGAREGSDKDATDFANKLVHFVNRDVGKKRPKVREYETEEFKEEHDYESYRKARHQKAVLGFDRIKARKALEKAEQGIFGDLDDEDPEAYRAARGIGMSEEDREKRVSEFRSNFEDIQNQIDELQDFLSNHPYQRGMSMIEKEYDTAVQDYHNSPLTAEYLTDDGSEAYDELVTAFAKLGGESETVIDV
jgi:hypothetical protein